MPHSTSRTANRKTITFSILSLILVTMIGVSISTASDIDLGEPRPASSTLSVDERTYYEFVAPRLDRLVVEIDKVAAMVDGKSRDIVALTVSGNRIEELSKEILEFGSTHGVPSRFANVHGLIVDATGNVTSIFDEAREALRRFNFSQMTKLVSQFSADAQIIHLAQDEMLAVAGTEPALRASNQ